MERPMPVPLTLVDAFTDRPFAGNPAAVCVLPAWRDDAWLQSVAAEMKQSETAFLVRSGDAFELRWFTPTVEVDLCGHATLASAHSLWEQGLADAGGEIAFRTRSGVLRAVRSGREIELDFPLVREEPADAPAGLVEALGVTPRYVGRCRFAHLIELSADEEVRQAQPDFPRLARLPISSVILTSRSTNPRFDFVSRFFAPGAGIDEDPVTGSAHCCLADFWRKRLGKDTFLAYQASRRGGVVRARAGAERVSLGGQAVTVSRGELLAD
jgi:PhzF family phenazine biosynthesis protein